MRNVILFALVLAACSPYSPTLPYEPFFCGSGTPQCPDGYSCMGSGSGSGGGSAVCVAKSGTMPDASNQNGMCANDTAVETQHGANNDTIATAYALPDPLPNNCVFTFSGLAICPMGDKDNYSLILHADGHTIQTDMTYETWGSPLSGSIANSGGTPIKTLTPTSTADTVSGVATNLPMGQYFIEIFGPTAAPGINNYKLTVTVTPCPN